MHFATVLSSLEEVLPQLAATGFAPELCPSDRFSLDQLKDYLTGRAHQDGALLRRAGLRPTWHGYFYSIDLGSVDEWARAYAQQVALTDLACAQAVGAREVVLHSGYVPVLCDFLFDYYLDVYAQSFAPVAGRAREMGLTLLIENVFDQTTRFSRQLMERFPVPHVGLCLDLGHWQVNGREPAAHWLELAPRIGRLHLHDNDGVIDRHWPVGEGVIDFAPVLQGLRLPEEQLTLEQNGFLDQAVASRAHLMQAGLIYP